MENKKVNKNGQKEIPDEKNVSQNEHSNGCKKTRLQKTKNETNIQHNILKGSKKAKTIEEETESNNLEENLGEYEEFSKLTNSFTLQNKKNASEETKAFHQNLGHPFQPNLG